MALNLRSQTAASTSGSQTITQSGPSSQPSATLHLRASAEPEEDSSNHVRWAEDVIDNEGMGKKSSKVCCIYHKPHDPGDSDNESSSSEEDSDSEPDLSRAQRAGDRKGKGRRGHDHDHGEGASNGKGEGKGKGRDRKPSPNAYERVPKHASPASFVCTGSWENRFGGSIKDAESLHDAGSKMPHAFKIASDSDVNIPKVVAGMVQV